MKKMLTTMALTLCGLAVFAAPLWDGDLSSVSLQFGKKLQDVSVKTEDGALLISGTSEGNSVTYISVEIRVKPFVLDGRMISMDLFSNDPKTTDAFYVRMQNAKRQNILSFQRWGAALTEAPKKYIMTIGGSFPEMKWEPAEIKAPETDPIDRILIFIGARGDGKPFSIKVKNIELSDNTLPKLVSRPGTALAASGSGCFTKAVKNGETVNIDALPLTNGILYTYAKVPFTGNITGKKLVMTGSSATPGVTGALYIRGFNAKKECILSYRTWDYPFKAGAKNFTLTPGTSSSGLQWEPDRVKTGADPNLAYLELIIGCSKQKNKLMNAEFKGIKLQ